ncbi:SMI1/KNR4 family protein [Chitinophaga eiseniae]|uniref:Benzoate transporter n=1 Tax=Chitinophaga eiseniae TaxID=634771 RepID=A0A847SNI0_9BACT|nr:SMI1/KNR4 family protein [Chitinophaga eiseniae]NLR81383.1 benzoate transporter [Chitinophaga eiseniae]
MQEQLALLEQYLEAQRPDLLADLNPALTPGDIKALEQKYNCVIPAPVAALYQWRNGQSFKSFDAFVNNSTFVPLEDAMDTMVELTGMIGTDFQIDNWWHAGWWPLFHNGGGDYICYDAHGLFTGQAGQLLEFWHADNDRPVIAPDLVSLIAALNQYYAAAPSDNEDEFFEITSPAGYPKKFRVK